jgi:hypothetical protein
MYWRIQERAFTPDGRSGQKSLVGFLVRRTAWGAGPGTETGMPRNFIRDAKGAQRTHMVRRAPSFGRQAVVVPH